MYHTLSFKCICDILVSKGTLRMMIQALQKTRWVKNKVMSCHGTLAPWLGQQRTCYGYAWKVSGKMHV